MRIGDDCRGPAVSKETLPLSESLRQRTDDDSDVIDDHDLEDVRVEAAMSYDQASYLRRDAGEKPFNGNGRRKLILCGRRQRFTGVGILLSGEVPVGPGAVNRAQMRKKRLADRRRQTAKTQPLLIAILLGLQAEFHVIPNLRSPGMTLLSRRLVDDRQW